MQVEYSTFLRGCRAIQLAGVDEAGTTEEMMLKGDSQASIRGTQELFEGFTGMLILTETGAGLDINIASELHRSSSHHRT